MTAPGIQVARDGLPSLFFTRAMLRHPDGWVLHLPDITDHDGLALSHGLFDWEIAPPHPLLMGWAS